MLLQKRHEAAIEVEFVMGRPCPITTWFPPKEPEEAPSPPRLRGFFFCAPLAVALPSSCHAFLKASGWRGLIQEFI